MLWNQGFPATPPVIFIGLLHLKKRSKEKKTRGEKIANWRQTQKLYGFYRLQATSFSGCFSHWIHVKTIIRREDGLIIDIWLINTPSKLSPHFLA